MVCGGDNIYESVKKDCLGVTILSHWAVNIFFCITPNCIEEFFGNLPPFPLEKLRSEDLRVTFGMLTGSEILNGLT